MNRSIARPPSRAVAHAVALAVSLLVPLLVLSTPAAADQRLERSPGAAGATAPILLASSDCADDGRSAELMQFEVRNVDVVDHEVEIVFDGEVIDRRTVPARGSVRDRVPVDVSWDDLPLTARLVDASDESVSMLVRPSRCITRTIGREVGPRVNGPAGVLGLVCVRGELFVEFDMENVDTVARSMSINLYSEGRLSVNDVEVVPRREVPAGGRLRGLVRYPFGAVGFPDGYDGDTLIRAWFRDVVDDPVEQYAYHARVWYEETPPCVAPLDARVLAAARQSHRGAERWSHVSVVLPLSSGRSSTYR